MLKDVVPELRLKLLTFSAVVAVVLLLLGRGTCWSHPECTRVAQHDRKKLSKQVYGLSDLEASDAADVLAEISR